MPNGLIHHWIGTSFIRGATLDRALALLQDYDHHSELYAPMVTRSKLLKRTADHFVSFLRFRQKKVITVVVNTENEARFSRPAADRADGQPFDVAVLGGILPDAECLARHAALWITNGKSAHLSCG